MMASSNPKSQLPTPSGIGLARLPLGVGGWELSPANISDSDLSQVPAVPPGAVERRAHTRQDVLFDDDPAVVAGAFELPQHAGEIDGAFAQLAEESVAQCRLIVPLFVPG